MNKACRYKVSQAFMTFLGVSRTSPKAYNQFDSSLYSDDKKYRNRIHGYSYEFFCAIPIGIKNDLAIFLVNFSRNNYSNTYPFIKNHRFIGAGRDLRGSSSPTPDDFIILDDEII